MITVDPHKTEKENQVKRKTSTLLWMVFLIFAFGAGLATGYYTWGSQAPAQAQAPDSANDAAQPQATQVQQRFTVSINENDPALGPADAPVTIIEFSDFECPYCRKWFVETWPQIKSTYAGKVRLVYRDFPLSFHPNSQSAAVAASCAGEQGKYWEYHDLLFSGAALGTDTYSSFASQLKLDMTKYQDCVTSQRYVSDVQADLEYGSSLGITGTPTFFVNGIPLVGAQPFSAFKSIIDKELASKK